MTPKEHLIASFKLLCSTTSGGVEAIADEIDSSAETLKQVLKGTKLKSGEPRGIGPSLQRRLTKAYPGWAELSSKPTPRAAPTDLEQALQIVGMALASVPKETRAALAANLSGWATDGGADHWRAAIHGVLSQAKRRVPGR